MLNGMQKKRTNDKGLTASEEEIRQGSEDESTCNHEFQDIDSMWHVVGT